VFHIFYIGQLHPIVSCSLLRSATNELLLAKTQAIIYISDNNRVSYRGGGGESLRMRCKEESILSKIKSGK